MRNPFKKFLSIKEVEKDVEGSSERAINEKQKALKRSIREGSSAGITTNVGDSYITPFADVLGAQPFHVGLLSSFSSLLSPFSQLLGSKLMLSRPRKRIVLTFVFLHALTWLVIAALAFLAFMKGKSLFFVYLLILIYAGLSIWTGLAFPAWFSWMGDLVPEKDRGKYFSKRNLIIGVVGLVAFLIASFILDTFKNMSYTLLGFVVLFFLAFLFRIFSFSILKKQYSPKLKIHSASYFSFFSFLKRFDNYGKFSLYLALFEFAIMTASPFFAVYMLQELGYNQNYILYTLVAMSSSVFYLIFTPIAGKFSDKYGNTRLLAVANLCFIFTPLFWLPSKNPIYLIIVPQLIAGIANAAFIIASTNFTYDAVSREKRGLCIAYTNILIGVGSFFGALLGGVLLKVISFQTINKFFVLFILASFLRLLVALIFLPKIKEVKKVSRLPPMHVHFAHPFRTIHAEIGWFKKIVK